MALQQALDAVATGGKITYSISAVGRLVAETQYKGKREKKRLQEEIDKVAARWQMEVINVVACLMDYETQVSESVGGVLTLEGEKDEGGRVNQYVRVILDPDGESEMAFEHFADPDELKVEEDKFLALMQKLGIDIAVSKTRREGTPIPADAIHRHFLKQGG
jgi:hypothetical protein